MDNVKRLFFILCMVCGIFAANLTSFSLNRSLAQNFDIKKLEKIPDYSKELTEDEFFAQTDLVEEASPMDKALAFEIRLPKDWTQSSSHKLLKDDDLLQGMYDEQVDKIGVKTERKTVGTVTKYYSPNTSYYVSRFEIEAFFLEFDITAKNWFLNDILARGYNLIGMEVVSETEVNALYVTLDRDVSYIVRTNAQINGERIIVSSYYLPDERWDEERAMQQRVMESLYFTTPEEIQVETRQTYEYLNLIKFDYPSSWRLLAPEVFSIDGMEATLIRTHDNQVINGEINIRIISTRLDTDIKNEIELIKKDLREMRSIKPGKYIETKDGFIVQDYIKFNRVDVYSIDPINKELENRTFEHEFWIGIMIEDDFYYLVSMLTPSRKANFFTWARNSEAFKMVYENIRI